jgi:hypothetical protein
MGPCRTFSVSPNIHDKSAYLPEANVPIIAMEDGSFTYKFMLLKINSSSSGDQLNNQSLIVKAYTPPLGSFSTAVVSNLSKRTSESMPCCSKHGPTAMIDPHHLLDSWKASNHTTHCSWPGVQCDHIGQVMALDLSSRNISSPFPSHVTNLRALRLLNVSNNFFNGSFPSDISNLRNLATCISF